MALGAERTATIVQDLRTFSRLGEEVPRPTDLHEAIEVSLRLFAAALGRPDHDPPRLRIARRGRRHPGTDEPGVHESPRQRVRRHPRSGQSLDPHRARGRARRHRHPGRRHRHRARARHPRLRSLLHHQTRRTRHRPRAGDHARHREPARRYDPRRDRAGQRNRVPGRPAHDPRSSTDARVIALPSARRRRPPLADDQHPRLQGLPRPVRRR